jgi:hypothetical protein
MDSPVDRSVLEDPAAVELMLEYALTSFNMNVLLEPFPGRCGWMIAEDTPPLGIIIRISHAITILLTAATILLLWESLLMGEEFMGNMKAMELPLPTWTLAMDIMEVCPLTVMEPTHIQQHLTFTIII